MNFFDVVKLHQPNVLENYDNLEILEDSKDIIISKGNEKFCIWISYNDLYLSLNKYRLDKMELIKINPIKIDFDYSLYFAKSFKEIRHERHLETLNAVIGFFMTYNDNHLYFDAERTDYQKHSNIRILEYQNRERSVCFKKMNETLSYFYELRFGRGKIKRAIDCYIKLKNVSNHDKLNFLNSYENYRQHNKLDEEEDENEFF